MNFFSSTLNPKQKRHFAFGKMPEKTPEENFLIHPTIAGRDEENLQF